MLHGSISESLKIIPLALAPDADLYAADPQTDWIRAKHGILFLISEGVGGTGTAIITVTAASSNAGADNEDIAFRYRLLTTSGGLDTWGPWLTAAAAGVTPAAGAAKATLVELRFDEIPELLPFVALTLTEVADSPVDAAVIALVSSDREGVEIPTVLA